MTDNDIIKALECCVKDDKGEKGFCNENCPLFGEGYICADFLRSKTLDLLNRKDAEIEKLNVELVGMRGACESYKMHYDNAQAEIKRLKKENHQFADICKMYSVLRAEAIKEFAERLTDRASLVATNMFDSKWEISQVTIDNLVKEMTEGSDTE